jgi:hypothetical protein
MKYFVDTRFLSTDFKYTTDSIQGLRKSVHDSIIVFPVVIGHFDDVESIDHCQSTNARVGYHRVVWHGSHTVSNMTFQKTVDTYGLPIKCSSRYDMCSLLFLTST